MHEKMGDDIHDDYFEIVETDLIESGGGGAYQGEEEALEIEEVSSDENAREVAPVSSSKLKRKEKLKEIKDLKRRKKEEGKDEGISSNCLDLESQLRVFMKTMPKDKETGKPIYEGVDEGRFYNTTRFLGSSSTNWKDNSFVMAVASGLKSLDVLHKRSDEMGCPSVIVLCASALRASHVLNGMSSLLRCSMAKCWSKHFKAQDQAETLSKKAYPVVVGTPGRISKLFKLGALCGNKLEIVLIDNGRNKKAFTLLSLPDTRNDTYNLLKEHLSARNVLYGIVASMDVID